MTNLQTVSLSDIQMLAVDLQGNRQPLSSLNTKIWLASASFDPKQTTLSRQQLQKIAVRKLASQLASEKLTSEKISTLPFQEIHFNESIYPYRLQPLGYPVSFSHTHTQVACVIGAADGSTTNSATGISDNSENLEKLATNESAHKTDAMSIGIDIELNPISSKVSQRYFHPNERQWLHDLEQHNPPSSALCQQARNLLWMLKEASIKTLNTGQLISGLKVDFSLPAQQLLSQYQQYLQSGLPVNATTFFSWKQESRLSPCPVLPSYSNSTPCSLVYIYLPYLSLVVVVRIRAYLKDY